MTASHLKLVTPHTVDDHISEIAADIAAGERALIRNGGKPPSNGNGSAPADLLPPDDGRFLDDLGNAERFLAEVGQDLLYAAEAKKWLYWKGTHWAWDHTDFVFEMVTAFARGLYSPAVCRDDADWKHAKRSNNRAGLNAIYELAQRKCSASIDSFDDAPYKLNCRNGTLDLRTGSLDPHDRGDRITRVIPFDYVPDAHSQVFEDFINKIQPDPAIRAFLQRSVGYSLLGTVRERSFWILHGTGNNGKSIFTNLFNNLLGDYASTTTTASIMAGRQTAVPNDIARLKGKRFIVVPETEENERMNAALVKALSAGDKVTARFLFAEYFDFYFTGKLWIATNHKPTITDHSKGFWDRIKLVPFTVDIPADEVIKSDDMMSRLMADASAVLAWAVQGCRDYFEMDGLDVPEIIQREIDAYRREQDSIAQFIEERCETLEQRQLAKPDEYLVPADFQVKNSDLYAAYKEFCTANGEYLRSHRRLTQNMHERGFKQHNSGGRYWEGIRLLDL
jgi:putative DNA primase/helicase